MKTKIQIIDLGFIGHKASQLQSLFSEYSATPNESGNFLHFENYTDLVFNHGVMVTTNCFNDEAHFNERLMLKLLYNIKI